jgi:hypothetical protein
MSLCLFICFVLCICFLNPALSSPLSQSTPGLNLRNKPAIFASLEHGNTKTLPPARVRARARSLDTHALILKLHAHPQNERALSSLEAEGLKADLKQLRDEIKGVSNAAGLVGQGTQERERGRVSE